MILYFADDSHGRQALPRVRRLSFHGGLVPGGKGPRSPLKRSGGDRQAELRGHFPVVVDVDDLPSGPGRGWTRRLRGGSRWRSGPKPRRRAPRQRGAQAPRTGCALLATGALPAIHPAAGRPEPPGQAGPIRRRARRSRLPGSWRSSHRGQGFAGPPMGHRARRRREQGLLPRTHLSVRRVMARGSASPGRCSPGPDRTQPALPSHERR